MATHPPSLTSHRLDRVTLDRLADAVSAARNRPRAVPLIPLLEIARALDVDDAVTVDFEACAVLGHPLVVVRPNPHSPPPGVFAPLTKREREVVHLLADGLTNAAMATRLRISIGTVKDHVHHILEKTGCRRRTQVVALWVAAGGV